MKGWNAALAAQEVRERGRLFDEDGDGLSAPMRINTYRWSMRSLKKL